MTTRLAAALCLALAAPSAFAANSIHVHASKKRKPAANAPPPQKPHLDYYGGKVIANVKVVPVFWGPNVDASVQKQIGTFYADFVQSSMFDWLSEYDTTIKAVDGSAGTGQHIGKGSAVSPVTITPSRGAAGATITDAKIQGELATQIKAGKLPRPDSNTIYMLHFAPRTVITQGGSKSCKDFCAYHGTIKSGASEIYYGVMPDEGKGSGCDLGCGKGGVIGNLTASAAHEIVEAITDAEVGLVKGSGARKPMAWYDPHKDATGSEYAEIGDICSDYEAPITVNGRTWTVQKMWSNKAAGCIVQANDTPTPVAANSGSSTSKTGADHKGAKKARPASTKAPRRPSAG